MARKQLVLEKTEAFAAVTNTFISVLGLDTMSDGTIVDAETMAPVYYNEKILRRHTLHHAADIGRGVAEFNPVSGNILMTSYFFEQYLEDVDSCYLAYGQIPKKGKRSENIPNKCAWCIVLDIGNGAEISITSDFFANKNLGLIQLLFKLEMIDLDEALYKIEE